MKNETKRNEPTGAAIVLPNGMTVGELRARCAKQFAPVPEERKKKIRAATSIAQSRAGRSLKVAIRALIESSVPDGLRRMDGSIYRQKIVSAIKKNLPEYIGARRRRVMRVILAEIRIDLIAETFGPVRTHNPETNGTQK